MTALPNGIASQVNSLEEIIMQEGIETINWIFSSYSYKGKYGINNVKSLYIPASVKTIKSDAFCDFGNLETITFAEGSQLETIERYAFKSCVSLKTINGIPASLATIGEYAFKDCTSLEALDLSATAVTAIEQYTFHKASSLTDVKLPSGLTTIATYAFYNTSLKNLTVPATVTTIGVSAFENSALETVAFSAASTLTAIEENVFKGTENLKTVKLPNLLKEIGAGAFENSGVQEVLMTDENIPSSLTTIGANAFANCANLVGFAHLEQVTSIGEKAFFCCSNLENTKVSESLTDLGAMAFAFCNKLTEGYYPAKLATLGGNAYAGLDASKISLSSDNKNFVAVNENGVLTIYDYEKSIVYAVYGATGAYEITEKGTETYAPGALAGNAITSSNIPARLETVPNYMFMNCTSLASVDLAEELTEIGQYAFYNTALETITIPSTVKTIGDYAFAYNAKIDNVVIPKSAVTIGNYVFAYCQTLSNFDFESFAEGESVKTQKVGTHFFYNCPNITEVILPDKINITDADKAESEISYANDIPSYMFAGTGIVNANIYENGVAFYFFTRGVFANCEKLVSVYIQEIPDHSGSSYGYCSTTYFEGCDNLKVIYVDSLDKAGYTVGNMANGMWPELHVKNSVKDESTAALNATAYFDEARNADFEVHFDADGYADIVEYFAGLNDAWNFKVYDKDGNRLYCSETNGSIAYVEDAAGNVIWGTKPAN